MSHTGGVFYRTLDTTGGGEKNEKEKKDFELEDYTWKLLQVERAKRVKNYRSKRTKSNTS